MDMEFRFDPKELNLWEIELMIRFMGKEDL